MANNCSNCGFEYNDGDLFCSRCGNKLSENNKFDIRTSISKFNLSTKETTNFNKNIYNNSIINIGIFLIATLSVLCLIMFVILDKHHDEKEVLKFKNLIENPAQIPILKESADYGELSKNLSKVEEFLLLYLRNSSDGDEKKEQIFISYLNELEKLPKIANQKIINIEECKKNANAGSCRATLNCILKDTGAIAYQEGDVIYLYPNYQFIEEKYKEYLLNDIKEYVRLRAKYNQPSSLNLNLIIKPTKLADKISDFEKLLSKTNNEYVKEKCEEVIYGSIRKFLFTSSIYATTTQEMKSEFKKAYEYFIKTYRNSNLTPLIMSYLDKKRAYNEENFKNDYPYKILSEMHFEDNVKNSVFEDVFVQLRKNIFANKNIDLKLAYVYDLKNGNWKKYHSEMELSSGEYVLSEPDENNNVSIYNNVFSPIQELNILNYSKLYLISDGLYIFNKNKLTISRIAFNGKIFNTYTLNNNDVTSLFPGIEVINIDAFQSYNVVIEKENARANYIILSKYSQGWNDYQLKCLKGEFNPLTLPNMFSVNSVSDVVLSLQSSEKINEEFQENKPSYKITIKTYGYREPQEKNENFVQYDKKTREDEEKEKQLYKPNIMPKLNSSDETTELEDENLLVVPEQKIEPPND
ncbi:MAG: zinc ribbon domain-containing protein [Candidatus Gastranaerophilales bacterium]|nr:zinc ribbon domain-containing protein [Candidatus Gastranaerophilales bacterium]